jgi:hypothetical protein
MPGAKTLLAVCAAAVVIFASLTTYGEDAPKPELTRQSCQAYCQTGLKKKNLDGPDLEHFNACADAQLCADPNQNYLVIGPQGLWG